MIVLMKNNVGYVKTIKQECDKEDQFDSENGRNIRQVFKIPSCVASGTVSTDENGHIDLMEMKLAPSCFIEAFLMVGSDDQRNQNMRECEYLLIELEKYIDYYGILDVCAK